MKNPEHVVMYSGGICSWATAKRVKERHPNAEIILLFADTKIEDEDLYRFLHQSAKNIGAELIIIEDGRTVWQVFEDVRLIGSSFADPCSLHLKRELLTRWVKANCPGAVQHFGLDWTELHRLERLRKAKEGQRVEAYMTDSPLMTKKQMIQWLESEGIRPPRLYGLGFHHNNCGGFCIKSGQAQFALLLRKFPDRYLQHEENELRVGDLILAKNPNAKKRQTILKIKGKNVTLREFREMIEAQMTFDQYDWGGCGCAVE
jgi:3'-phosphoadenosine 5'-phosphosulfate sulfotransferase (PAPS reductase)/FAD synthetase